MMTTLQKGEIWTLTFIQGKTLCEDEDRHQVGAFVR